MVLGKLDIHMQIVKGDSFLTPYKKKIQNGLIDTENKVVVDGGGRGMVMSKIGEGDKRYKFPVIKQTVIGLPWWCSG